MSAIDTSTTVDLYEEYKLASFFDPAEYKKKENAGYALHFLIALNQPYAVIEKGINPSRLQNKFTDREVTPLHLAVIRNKPDTVALLLDKGADANARDKRGYSPLHYAALLTDRAAYELLKKKGADPEAKTYLGMTCDQLRVHRGLEPAVWSQGKISVETDGNRQTVDLNSPGEVKKLLGFEAYTDEILFSEEIEAGTSSQMAMEADPYFAKFPGLMSKLLAALKKNPAALCIKEAPHLKALCDPRFAKGLYADQPFKPGDPVGSYAGHLVPRGPPLGFEGFLKAGPDDLFSYSDQLNLHINPKEASSAMRFINDDFPNCATLGTSLFTATAPIAQGESLSWDYGPGQMGLKWGKYLLGKKEEMKAYFQTRRLQSLSNITPDISQEKLFPTLDKLNKELYLLQTPAAAIYLCLSGVIKPREMLNVLLDPKNQNLLSMREFDQYFAWVATTLVILDQLDDMAQRNQEAMQQIRTFLLEQLDVLTMTQMVQTLHLVAQACAKPDFSIERWSHLKEKIRREMPAYQWEDDDKFILIQKDSNTYDLRRAFKAYPKLDAVLRQLGIIG